MARKVLSERLLDGVKPGAITQAHDGTWMVCVGVNKIPVTYWDKYALAWIHNGRRPNGPNIGGIDMTSAYTTSMAEQFAWIVSDIQDWGEVCP